MPATNIQLLRMYTDISGTALMWQSPFSHPCPFLSFHRSHVFILLPKTQHWYDSHLLP